MYAATNGHETAMVLLLAHGADPNHADAMGNTAIFWASQKPGWWLGERRP
jgi:ankyrin repeat protein